MSDRSRYRKTKTRKIQRRRRSMRWRMLTFQTRFDKEGSFPSLISGEKKKIIEKKIKKINLLAIFWLVCGGWVERLEEKVDGWGLWMAEIVIVFSNISIASHNLFSGTYMSLWGLWIFFWVHGLDIHVFTVSRGPWAWLGMIVELNHEQLAICRVFLILCENIV